MTTKRTFGKPGAFDLLIRDLAQHRLPSKTAKMMAPLFPVGMPGGYITIAYLTARWLRRRDHRGGPAIVTAAWLGFFAQRTVKHMIARARPRQPRVRRRTESFPSGHTTGTTAVAVAVARVLRREGLISTRTAMVIGAGAPLLMGVYRVIDDEHWATDVIAGWLLGAAIGLTCTSELAGSAGDVRDRSGNWYGVRQHRAAVAVGNE